jgi:hypothetical protein
MAQLRMPLIASPKAADPMLCAPLLYECRFARPLVPPMLALTAPAKAEECTSMLDLGITLQDSTYLSAEYAAKNANCGSKSANQARIRRHH